jgi:hypothetical protein
MHVCAANIYIGQMAQQVLFCRTSAGFSLPPRKVRSPRTIASADVALHGFEPVYGSQTALDAFLTIWHGFCQRATGVCLLQ